MTREEMAARIRELREAAGISQASAARHAGINQSTWQRYENGERAPTIHRFDTIARALNAPVGAFYDPAVLAELRITAETRARLAVDPQAVAIDLATRLLPTLLNATTASNAKPRRVVAVDRLSPVGVAERLVRAKRESLRIAEWQHAQAVRAQTVE